MRIGVEAVLAWAERWAEAAEAAATRDGDAIVIESGGKQERITLSSARGASLDGKALMPAIGDAAVGENTPQLPR